MKNINYSLYIDKTREALIKYYKMIFMVFIILLYSSIIFRINQLSSQSPTNEQLTQKLAETKGPTIDQDSLEKIQKLQDESVPVQALFKDARNNPFSDQ
ncbi:hypothetical protein A3F37_01240 [Candidatus Saccharibacteria bacterium RIFCSPHIGHO2_12_FULL_41_12]|nr:MAG: hypothetical protein A3F37_01240 [Candidatus Saccharibacteria bacterium RIFCSPHIGHO2_12_FULL_41_12]